MPLNIKNAEVERLVEEVVAITGETRTEAVRKALEERRTALTYRGADEHRRQRIQRFLASSVWPALPPEERGRIWTKEEEEELLGYGPSGA